MGQSQGIPDDAAVGVEILHFHDVTVFSAVAIIA